MDKLLTVIVPTYNMEHLLPRCLDSLVVDDQATWEKLEVLVVNDGSKDASSAIAHEYQRKYPNVFRVIDKENGNYGSCINCGLKDAVGKYVKILDADDYFISTSLNKLLERLEDIDVDVVITNFSMVNPRGDVVADKSFSLPENKVTDFAQLYTTNTFSCIEMHAIAYLRENLIKMGYRQTEGISYTDQEWMFLPMSVAKSFYYLPENLYQYLVGRDGQTVDPSEFFKNIGQYFVVLLNTMEFYDKLQNIPTVNKYYLCKRICSRIDDLFRIFLQMPPLAKNPEFEEFDLQMKLKYPHIYSETGHYSIISRWFPFHYLWIWRKTKSRRLVWALFELYSGMSNIVRSFVSRWKTL